MTAGPWCSTCFRVFDNLQDLQDHRQIHNVRDELAARVRELEAGLREYGRHAYTCEIERWFRGGCHDGAVEPACTCGLAALAGGESVSH